METLRLRGLALGFGCFVVAALASERLVPGTDSDQPTRLAIAMRAENERETASPGRDPPPPRIMLETTLVEITGRDEATLGILPLLGGPLPAGSGSQDGSPDDTRRGGMHPMATLLAQPEFRELIRRLDETPTNRLVELQGNQMEWTGRQASNAANVSLSAVLGPALTGLLTESQVPVLVRALAGQRGVEVFGLPRVTAVDGQRTQLRFLDALTIKTGINPEAIVQPGNWGRTNIPVYTTAPMSVGTTLDLLPRMATNGAAVHLMVTPTLTEFLGYDSPPAAWKVRVWQNGVKKRLDPPLPRFRVHQMQAQTVVPDGETLLVATWLAPESQDPRAARPGSVRRRGEVSNKGLKKRLLWLVRPIIVDPAGRRVRRAGAN